MIAEIVSVGTELLLGQVVNTDAQHIARRLSEAGVTAHHQTTVGDNPARLREAIEIALSRSDVVITTGGLGPTADDITKELSAEALDLPMERSAEAEAMVRGWFEKSRFRMTDNNLRQADFPRGAIILRNDFGTAPGCIIEQGGKAIVNLPGPPRELIPMFDARVMPYLAERSGARIVSRYLRIFGMGESAVESRVSDLMMSGQNPTVAPYCSLGEVQLRLTVRCAGADGAAVLLDPLEAEIRARLGGVIYAVTDDPFYTMERAAVEALTRAGKTLAVAESCTGGLIAARITDIPGASAVFVEGCVTYANEAKVRALGVSPDTLVRFGAVSEETAREMAAGLRARSGADIALSVTGIAGPGGGTAEKPVGTVWLALSTAQGCEARMLSLNGERARVRTMSALHALHWVVRVCEGEEGR